MAKGVKRDYKLSSSEEWEDGRIWWITRQVTRETILGHWISQFLGDLKEGIFTKYLMPTVCQVLLYGLRTKLNRRSPFFLVLTFRRGRWNNIQISGWQNGLSLHRWESKFMSVVGEKKTILPHTYWIWNLSSLCFLEGLHILQDMKTLHILHLSWMHRTDISEIK